MKVKLSRDQRLDLLSQIATVSGSNNGVCVRIILLAKLMEVILELDTRLVSDEMLLTLRDQD